jgi:hypothetical protein
MIIDSISAFYWQDRHEDELGRTRQRRIIKQITTLLSEYNLILFATKQTILKDEYKEYMGQQWSDLVHFRFHFSRV